MRRMLPPFFLHLALSFLWVLYQGNYFPTTVILGSIIAIPILRIIPLIPFRDTYVRRSIALLFFAFHFFYLFLRANFRVAWVVLTQQKQQSCFFSVYIEDMKTWEAIVLSHCITLTPGTVSVVMNEDGKTLTVHCLEEEFWKENLEEVEEDLKQRLLAFSR